MLKVVVFDLDGTLLDTIGDIANSMNDALIELGFETHAVDKYKTFLGDGASMLAKRALGENFKDGISDSFLTRYLEIYERRRLEVTKEFKDVTSTLIKLKEDYKLAVISNKPHKDTLPMVEYYFPNIFDYISGKKDDVLRKPAKDAMVNMLNYFNIKNDECIYVGDSHVDYEFALNSNVKCILLDYGYENKERFDTLTKCIKISNFKDVLSLV